MLQPELINSLAQAVIGSLPEDEREVGCIAETHVLSGDLAFPSENARLDPGDELIVLMAMHQILVGHGLCLRDDERPSLARGSVGPPTVLTSQLGYTPTILNDGLDHTTHGLDLPPTQWYRYSFRGDQMTTETSESGPASVKFHLDPHTNPKQLDTSFTVDGVEEISKGIYSIDGDILQLSWRVGGKRLTNFHN